MSEYRASIAGNGFSDPLDRYATLIVYRLRYDGLREYLSSDGQSLITVPPGDGGTEIGRIGMKLPIEAIEPIAQAIEKYQGHASHADTEARVLREWLEVERGRVDRAFDR